MKEILYVQAGSLSNYTGTHFWNAQESYFTYGEDDDPIVNHGISFRETIAEKNESILCPRLLIFDRKANFGTLSQSTALITAAATDADDITPLWNGSVVEYRQDPIPKSNYQHRMEDDIDEEDVDLTANEGRDDRYWSDFSRVYYAPQTIQRLYDISDWENFEGDWGAGKETFQRFNEESSLMEDSARRFVEECDTIQGIQILSDLSTFGSFTDSFLTSFRDEHPKLSALSFPFLSDMIPGDIEIDDARGRRKAVNDALCLRNLNELSTITIPIQSPSQWQNGAWSNGLDLDRNSLYQTSAVLSAHIETCTLPLRLKDQREDMGNHCAQLDWRGGTKFAQLSGIFPVMSTDAETLDKRLFDYSSPLTTKSANTTFARRDVSRGFHLSQISDYREWTERSPLAERAFSSIHASAYPIPTSFPRFFRPELHSPLSQKGTVNHPVSLTTTALSSVATGTRTSDLFSAYAAFVVECARRGADIGIDLEPDDLKELGNDLWTLTDVYAPEDAGGLGKNEGFGEDEE